MISLSNLVKQQWVSCEEEKKVVIDSNYKIEKHMRQWQREQEEQWLAQQSQMQQSQAQQAMPEGFSDFTQEAAADVQAMPEGMEQSPDPDGFTEGINALQIDPQEAGRLIEEARTEAESIVSDAQAQAEAVLADAQAQAQAFFDEQKQAGYEIGLSEGREETERVKRQLEEEFQAKKCELEEEYSRRQKEMEPELVDTILTLFQKVFGIQFSDKKEILLYLIENTLGRVESSRSFRIRVSEGNRRFVEENLERIRQQVGNDVTLEVAADATLDEKGCMIESEFGVFDCSVDVELDNLIRDIRSLAV